MSKKQKGGASDWSDRNGYGQFDLISVLTQFLATLLGVPAAICQDLGADAAQGDQQAQRQLTAELLRIAKRRTRRRGSGHEHVDAFHNVLVRVAEDVEFRASRVGQIVTSLLYWCQRWYLAGQSGPAERGISVRCLALEKLFRDEQQGSGNDGGSPRRTIHDIAAVVFDAGVRHLRDGMTLQQIDVELATFQQRGLMRLALAALALSLRSRVYGNLVFALLDGNRSAATQNMKVAVGYAAQGINKADSRRGKKVRLTDNLENEGRDRPRQETDDETPLQQLLRSERSEALQRALRDLDSRQRMVIELRIMKGRLWKEIKAEMGVPMATAHGLYKRGLENLKEYFGTHFPELRACEDD